MLLGRRASSKALAIAAISEDPHVFPKLAEPLRGERDVFLALPLEIRGRCLEYASAELRADSEVVLDAVTLHGSAIQSASPKLKANQQIVLAALTNDGLALRYVASKWRKSRDALLAAVQQNGLALEFADKKGSKRNQVHALEVVLAAVGQCGEALQFATDIEKNNAEIVLAAIQTNSMAYKFASEDLRQDPEIVAAALSQSTIETGLTCRGGNLQEMYASDICITSHRFKDCLHRPWAYEARRELCRLVPKNLLKKLL